MAKITKKEMVEILRKRFKDTDIEKKAGTTFVNQLLRSGPPLAKAAAAGILAFSPTEVLAGEEEALKQALTALDTRKRAGKRGVPGAGKTSPNPGGASGPSATLKKGGKTKKKKKNYSKGGGVRSANY